MTRRDMIIIAVLVNLGVLAVIFMTAIGFDDDHVQNDKASPAAFVEASLPPEPIDSFSQNQGTATKLATGDEVDRVLDLYASQENSRNGVSETLIVATPSEEYESIASTPSVAPAPAQPATPAKTLANDDSAQQFVEITVKKGDFLDKIARANGTTADRLMQINHLSNDRIDIGQILKVPVSNAKKSSVGTATTTAKKTEKKTETTVSAASDAQYYTVKSGDNPWKIARQFHVKFEDLLKLNNLNEEKARNLKVGDKIRVK